MSNQGFWVPGLEGTVDRLNALTLQYDTFVNLPSAGQIGKMYYATDQNTFHRDNGSSWDELKLGLLAIKSADETVNSAGSGSTFQDDDELLFAVAANGVYLARWFILHNSGTTPDIKFQFTVPSGALLEGNATYTNFNNTLVMATFNASSSQGAAGQAEDTLIIFETHIVVNSTPGNVTLQWAQQTSDAGDTKVLENSLILGQRIG